MTQLQTTAGITDGAQKVHRIGIREIGHGARGPVYSVHYGDELLLPKAREPLLESCRALAARGITGSLEMWRRGASVPAMRVEIATGAGLTVSDPDNGRPKVAKWMPRDFSGSDAD